MIEDVLLGWISFFVLLVSLGLLVVSVWKREKLTTESAWDMLNMRPGLLRWMFGLTFLSLLIYLFSESALLLSFEPSLAALGVIHEIGEVVNMFLALLVLVVAIPLVSSMLEGEDAN